ncbi:MAG: hypothetical protein ACRDBG_28080 [Waterburya sp.]
MKNTKKKPTMFDSPSYKFEIILIAFICMLGIASVNHSQTVNNQEQTNVIK